MYETNDSLKHHGIKGMKWGIRRFQNKDGSLTPEGKKRYEEDYESAKQRALKSGSAKDVLKFKGDLTNQELQNAINRIGLERQLSSMNPGLIKSGIDAVGKLTDAGNKVVNAWNLVAKINNTFKAKKLPVIGENKTEDTKSMLDEFIKSANLKDVVDHPEKYSNEELKGISKRLSYQAEIKKAFKSGQTPTIEDEDKDKDD